MRKETVYQYCVIDASGEVHHGLTTARSRAEMLDSIDGNYGEDCRYVNVHPLMGLLPEMRYGQWTGRIAPEGCGAGLR